MKPLGCEWLKMGRKRVPLSGPVHVPSVRVQEGAAGAGGAPPCVHMTDSGVQVSLRGK